MFGFSGPQPPAIDHYRSGWKGVDGLLHLLSVRFNESDMGTPHLLDIAIAQRLSSDFER